MEVISITGIVVNTLKYGENSKIINILTRDKGIIGVICKGALKEKSKLRVISNNFVYANYHIYYKEGKLGTLISADVIDYFLNIKSDIIKFSYMNYLCDLARNVVKESTSPEVYDILISALTKINEGLDARIITNIVEIKYLSFLGVGLNLDGCVICGRTSVVSMSINKGGYVCAFHKGNLKDMSASTLKMFKAYYYIDISKISELNIKEEVATEIDRFLNIYYKEYTGLYLKSKNFIDKVK